MTRLEMNNWTNPRTKEERIYINGWEEAVGLEIFRYKTGRISQAKYNGETLTNAEAGRCAAGKVYIIDNTLYMEDHSNKAVLEKEDKASKIVEILSEQGIEIENIKYRG